jgi:hypothetical protein
MADTLESGKARRTSSAPGFTGPGGSTRPGSRGPGDNRPGSRGGAPSPIRPRTNTGVRGGLGASSASPNANPAGLPSLDDHLRGRDADAAEHQAAEEAARQDKAAQGSRSTSVPPGAKDDGFSQLLNPVKDEPNKLAQQQQPGSQSQGGTTSGKTAGPTIGHSPSGADRKNPGGPTRQSGAAPGSFGGFQRLGGFLNKNRRWLAGGGGLATLIAVMIVGFIAIIPLQLLEIGNLMLKDGQQDLQHEFDRASIKMLKDLIGSRNSDPGGSKIHTGHPLKDMIHNMNIKNFNQQFLEDGGKMVFDKQGRLIGFEYLDEGKNVDLSAASFTERRSAVADLVDERIVGNSLWKVYQRYKYTKLMRAHANVSWRFWPKEKIDNIINLVWEKIRQGASTGEVEQETGENQQQAQQEQAAAESSGEVDASGAINTVEQTADKTHSTTEAIQAGIKVIKDHPFFGITGMVAIFCIVDEMAQKAATQGYNERTDALLRAGNLVPTIASQEVTGMDINDISEYDQTASLFTGNPNAPPSSQDRLPWYDSASAKRAMGQPVNSDPKSPGFNPDLNEAANPDGNVLLNLISEFSSVINDIPGASFTCNILTGLFGSIIQVGLQITEFAVNIVDGEIEEVLSSGADLAIQTALFGWVLPKALEAATGLAVSTNNAVDLTNNGFAGLSLATQDDARSMGGRELTNTEEAQINNEAQNENTAYAEAQGWRYNLFATSNPDSLLSRVILKTPDNASQAMADLGSIPHSIITGFAAVFLGVRPVDAATPTNINPYGWQFYGFTDAEIDKYDPIQNEDFLTQPIPGHPGVTRLSMLGDPSHYDPDNGDDPNGNDLLHCFVNKYSDQHVGLGFEAPGSGDICQGLGLVTTRDGNQVFNPTDQQIVNTIYCQNNNVCGLAPNDDFLRYRLELFYTNILTSMDCETTDQPCFTGNDADSD